MGDNIESAVNNLSEQTKLFEIASYYTHGNLEKAKEMVSGSYKDVYAIKLVFTTSVYGAALIFLNNIYMDINSCYMILSQSFDVGDIKTNTEWKLFEKTIAENIELKEHDDILSNQLREGLLSSLNIDQCNKLKALIEQNDAIAINHVFSKILQAKTGFQKVTISVDVEPLSSLEMELFSTSSKKINPNELKGASEEEKKEKKEEKKDDQDDNPLSGKEVKLVLKGSLILSPIKGKDISKLTVGERVKISIIDKSTKAISVAKAFNAVSEDGKMHPINGRIVSIKFDEKKGYTIFAIVAKAIYMHIEEEEKNLKVAMDDSTMASASTDSASSMSMPLVLGLAFVLLVLITAIILFLK